MNEKTFPKWLTVGADVDIITTSRWYEKVQTGVVARMTKTTATISGMDKPVRLSSVHGPNNEHITVHEGELSSATTIEILPVGSERAKKARNLMVFKQSQQNLENAAERIIKLIRNHETDYIFALDALIGSAESHRELVVKRNKEND